MDPHTPHQPRPVSDATGRREGEALTIRRCLECGLRLAPVITTCTACRSMALEWVISSGEGSIVSWKVVHRPTHDADPSEWKTSVVAIVELDDGPWIYTTLEGEVLSRSGRPVRVKYTPEPDREPFPVFTTHTTDDRDPAGCGKPQNQHKNDRKGTRSMAETTRERTDDSTWVRSCLHQCDFLAATQSVDTEARARIRYAIQWAPFGGASTEHLLMTFGISRWRFVQTVREILRPRVGDDRTVRTFKRNLMDAVSWGWRMYSDSSTVHT